MEKIASFDRGWLRVGGAAVTLADHVEKIASFDRGWLLGVAVAEGATTVAWRK